MKHEVTTFNTKKTLSESLKRLMLEKPLSKITVSELIKDCGVNRKTFYYHFVDIYALLKWTLDQEAITVVEQFDLLLNFEDTVNFILDYVESNKHILACAYDSMGREQLKKFLSSDFDNVVGAYINGIEKENHLHVKPLFKKHLTHVYSEAVAGILIELITDINSLDRSQYLQFISLITKASIPNVLRAAEKEL
ncbi:MAG: hypothetical protein PWP24_665 [Clostridiales bacterium]|nr:hypothetical protein [Clostridiales bacterium]